MMKLLIRVFLVLCLLPGAGSLMAADLRVGATPRLPTVTTIDGKTLDLAALRGKVLVLSYFSVTCPFCMNEAPKLQKLHHDNPDRLVVLTVSIDERDPQQKEKVAAWVARYKITHAVTNDYARLLPVLGKPKGLPVHYVFDRQGTLQRLDIGEIMDEDFDDIARFARSAP